MSDASKRKSRPIPNRKNETTPANGPVTVRKMTDEERARTDLFVPSSKQFKVLDLHFEGGKKTKGKKVEQ